MSSLRERLLRHKKPEAAGASGAPSGKESPQADERVTASEWDVIQGELYESEWGSFVLRRVVYEAGKRHGRYEIDDLRGQAGLLKLLMSDSEVRQAVETNGIRHDQLLFLDTETTGLGLGAGNVPFMIGIGYYTDIGFQVEQMLIRHPGEEHAMLCYLQQKLAKHPYLVSYNGKTFDWPIIKNRYVMNRLKAEHEPLEHLDFLYPSRSLWRNTLPSCRLGKVEEARLQVFREDDVPGSLAPELYFRYLAERDPAVLQGVFVHNELDLLSLAGLAIHFVNLLQGRVPLHELRSYGFEEVYRFGLWLDKNGLSERAEQVLDLMAYELLETEAGDGEEDELVAEDTGCLLPLAQYYKGRERYALACRLWKRYIALKGEKPTCSLEPYVELAMYYEHKEKCYESAIDYAEQALNKVWQRSTLKRSTRGKGPSAGRRASQETKDESADLEKRLERLKRKQLAGLGRNGPRKNRASVTDKQPPSLTSRNLLRKASSDEQLSFTIE
ncbi:ribonuclease H-like domain-containing protein [Paenibacillus sp. GD4]|uniref:ribonuclease H-like domain-containing protein n=1 Tax=Paenibacillus sp. GD4 TaxID=3068890 RepID=UPI002796A333|nr:ribonuclease H-like domain-containing protein [Paenibacillus sp. GD4]MDQ1909232.1 ribonuclease H-like domain-containing protein [Paenibacillus sp. GD4]